MIDNQSLKVKLQTIQNLEVRFNYSLKEHTTFKVGGPTDIFATPFSLNALKKLLKATKNQDLDRFILGEGSNIIVADKGVSGLVINMTELNKIKVKDTDLIAQTGATLTALADKALAAGLTGVEFATGIPGSLGGALYMNAGAYGGEIKDVVTKVLCLNETGEEIMLSKEEVDLSYRHSIFQEKDLIAFEAHIELDKGDERQIKEKMDDLNQKRWAKQPMEMPSAGSIFKRPVDHYAGALIEAAGLKGTKVGDAQVSTKHAGFIVNLGSATAQDIKRLIKKVQHKVYQKSGIKLEIEPKFIGDFTD
ncbi:UDP-N-acetylenolpyruvoylglucosamine reductase [Halobacteroides halobius DSM 5150]|uniref:UDP-N-acetylenolpyruvoylglucosamine reductase n=1 Tax=Halobacteroides halobius (strain ATCC 35273 / DSM 5150 / MD-1) TaxID=748449 RepID=L0KA96_HALHC|nr:UDP-N-acetylmuramate dehydrogenase [Halobacteroides halobius]AGB41460.1 UDP-N-acetylenolpyruvoylglucosamine reductase [Halobacteroides halobius DSM 5150]